MNVLNTSGVGIWDSCIRSCIPVYMCVFVEQLEKGVHLRVDGDMCREGSLLTK